MRGILAGLARTLEHMLRPRPVTRKYPYEKRELPERSRGLIALLLEPETSIFKCESCLMCEKACPPRAISISYRFKNGFRKRPSLAPRASYYRIRMVQTAPYGARRPMTGSPRTGPITCSRRRRRPDRGPGGGAPDPLPASAARRLLDGQAPGALQRARALAPDELIATVEASGLRGRGGAGFPLA